MDKLLELKEKALEVFVGAGSAGGRTHTSFGQPIYMDHAEGSKLYDVNGKEYIDYHNASGAALYGWKHPRLMKAIDKAQELGCLLNHDSIYQIELAKKLADFFPCCEKVRFANTGTDCTMGALRLARAYTGRDLIVKMDGHFHGMHELIWYNTTFSNVDFPTIDENGVVTETVSDTEGVPADFLGKVITVEFNNIHALEYVAQKYKDRIAAVILEPISYNCGCVPARKEYLEQVRELCTKEGIVLIFDEVITGLRLRPGSAQAYFGVTPDLTTIAKAIGGGLKSAYLLGKSEFMGGLSPVGECGMSGTYTGSLISTMASLEAITMANEPEFYDHIDELADVFYPGVNDLFKKHGIKGHLRGYGARFCIFFGVEDPEDDFSVRKVSETYDPKMDQKFLIKCIENGLYFHDYGHVHAPLHRGFSIQHSMDDISVTLEKMDKIFAEIK